MNMRLLLLLFLVFIYCLPSFSQNVITKNEKKLNRTVKKARRDSLKADKIAKGKFMITPIIAPAYSPELGVIFTVGAFTSFKTNPKDTLIQRSSFPFTASYTTTGAIVANGFLNTYWFKDKLRINADFWYKDMPDHYWGVGYINGAYINTVDSTTEYRRKWWVFNPRFLYQFHKNLFVGLNVDYNYTKGSEPSTLVANDENYIEYNDKPLNSGIGAIFRYDSRDVSVDIRSGMMIDYRLTFFSTKLGGNNNYTVHLFDYRHAQKIGREGSTLVWQVKGRFAIGNVPYGETSQLGTPFDLRGYTWGRYRDKQMIFLLTEYRYKFRKKNKELSKHGVVTWVGTGTIFNKQSIQDKSHKWLPNVGLGYRFEVQDRLNVRLDYGFGRQTSGFYFSFNQAF
jgi:hypothetical protein